MHHTEGIILIEQQFCFLFFLVLKKLDMVLHLLTMWFAASPACESVHHGSRSGLDLLWQASCLHSFTSLCLWSPQLRGETGLSEGEWQAKPVLTQHLKPPHKYRLPFPISKQPIHLCLHAYTLLHVMCRGVSLKMTTGHLADPQRVELWCAALQFSSTSAEPNPPSSTAERLRSAKWAR